MRLLDRLRTMFRNAFDRPTPLVKQSASVFGLAVALVIIAIFPQVGITNVPTAVAGIALVGIGTVLAVIFTKRPSLAHFQLIIPAIDILGFGAFRAGTGIVT